MTKIVIFKLYKFGKGYNNNKEKLSHRNSQLFKKNIMKPIRHLRHLTLNKLQIQKTIKNKC
jgi:hypothetical protein